MYYSYVRESCLSKEVLSFAFLEDQSLNFEVVVCCPMRMDDASMISMGQSSTALAMANDAIDNARRAAASSRMKRASSPPPAHTHRKQQYPQPSSSAHHANSNLEYVNQSGDNTTYTESDNTTMIIDMSSPSNISSRDLEDLDLKHNDAAFNVVATLLCERLLPKIDMTMEEIVSSPHNNHFTISAEDVTFFQKMLPNSVRRDFVNALRYRLNLLRVVGSNSGIVHHHHNDDEMEEGGGGCEQLSLQCQMLGLDRDGNMNLLLDNNFTAGKKVSLLFVVCHIHVYSDLCFHNILLCVLLSSLYKETLSFVSSTFFFF